MGVLDKIHNAAEEERDRRNAEEETYRRKSEEKRSDEFARRNGQYVHVVDFNVPFWSLVKFMVKASLASLPAVIILYCIYGLVTALFGAVFLAGIR